jgi:hypothetical protein
MITVTTVATGTVAKSLRQNLSNIPGKHEIKETRKIPIGHCTHILREVLVSKYRTYLACEITLHVAQTVNTEQLQPCIP